MSIFITGTDTDVGKTIIATWLTIHTGFSYWKPIQTGSSSDSLTLSAISPAFIHKEAYSLKEPLSPYHAAKSENIFIDPQSITLPSSSPCIVEGAGGVFVPITQEFLMIDLIKQLNLPVIVVARSSLGTINHTCLTLSALRALNIPIKGVIMNGEKNQLNKEAIEKFGHTKVLAEIPHLQKIDYDTLSKIPFQEGIV